MMRIRDIRYFAWQQLKGKRGAVVGAYILLVLLALLLGIVLSFPLVIGYRLVRSLLQSPLSDLQMGILMPMVGILAALLIVLIVCLYAGMSLGLLKLFLRISKGEQVKSTEVFSGFRTLEHWQHYSGVLLMVFAVQFLLLLPQQLSILVYGEDAANTAIVQCITQLLLLVASLHLTPAPYISADHPELGAWECIRVSLHLMRKRKWRLFLLQVSFIPLTFLLFLVPSLMFLLFYAMGNYIFAYSMSFFLFIAAFIIFCILILPHLKISECAFYLYAYGEDYGQASPFQARRPWRGSYYDGEFREPSMPFTTPRMDAADTGKQGQAPSPMHTQNPSNPPSVSFDQARRNAGLDINPRQDAQAFNAPPAVSFDTTQQDTGLDAGQNAQAFNAPPTVSFDTTQQDTGLDAGQEAQANETGQHVPQQFANVPATWIKPQEMDAAGQAQDNGSSTADAIGADKKSYEEIYQEAMRDGIGAAPRTEKAEVKEDVSYKTEEDAWDSYLRWKKDHGIGMEAPSIEIPNTEAPSIEIPITELPNTETPSEKSPDKRVESPESTATPDGSEEAMETEENA